MTSVGSPQAHPTHLSPRDRLREELASEVSSGTISSSDETALSAALDTIDQAMQAERASGTATRPSSPEEMQKKIAALVDAQVEAGTLTSDQASELKSLFESAAPKGGPGGPGGGPGGPPPPEGEATAESGSEATDVADLMKKFLEFLRSSQTSTTAYATDGSSSSATSSALVLDTSA